MEPEGSRGRHATPVVSTFGDTRLALLLGPSHLVAVEPSTRTPAWSYAHEGALHPVPDPVVHDEGVFLSLTMTGTRLFLGGKAPQEEWKSTDVDSFPPPSVQGDGYLYGSFIPQYPVLQGWGAVEEHPIPFRCVDWKTGMVMWTELMSYVTLAAADDKLILIELGGTLHAVEASPKSCKEIAGTRVLAESDAPKTFAVPPVLCNGKLYCRNFAGELTCIDVSGAATP